ncbi:MAG: UDP-N-acetylmuramoyl-tripeptide--D-alanyl-D-alanine ligase [candidate division Zixibacteria bacterium]|nr:UDP-N-acetylmuramoyl-tripeptide--D-alanyl-D-alanine ligase [candidate division Zixibacteria bacterium]
MIELRFDRLAAVTGGTLYNTEGASDTFSGVTIDSRADCGGKLFVALRGPRYDGHDYITAAVDRGASGIVAELNYSGLQRIPGCVPVVAVGNSHEAMLSLASNYRATSRARFVAITGSNGKTTSKELTYLLLQVVESNVYRSPGNLNNLFGVPLALFGVPSDAVVAVLELGISTKSEMPRLAEIVRPQLIAITNVGPSHLESLASVEDVARAKLQLVNKADHDVPVIVNADDPILVHETRRLRKNFITFGFDTQADFHPDNVETLESGATLVTIENNRFHLQLPGRHQVSNLLVAYAICRTLGYSFYEIDTENITLSTAPMRGQRMTLREIDFVVDCYNANPPSMQAGLEAFFASKSSGRRVLILGDMLELGPEAVKYHREVGEMLAGYEFDLAVLVGPLSVSIADAARGAGIESNKIQHFDSATECAEVIKENLQSNDLVYLKASRGVGLEVVLDQFRDEEVS